MTEKNDSKPLYTSPKSGSNENIQSNDATTTSITNLQIALRSVIVQLLNRHVQKVCIEKCFGMKFSNSTTQNDKGCLAKCMDRMYESHTIVMQSATSIAQSLNAQDSSSNSAA